MLGMEEKGEILCKRKKMCLNSLSERRRNRHRCHFSKALKSISIHAHTYEAMTFTVNDDDTASGLAEANIAMHASLLNKKVSQVEVGRRRRGFTCCVCAAERERALITPMSHRQALNSRKNHRPRTG